MSNIFDSQRVAIVLPVYNVAPYLRECLDSLLQQSYANFKVFAVDDGSTDGSGDVLDRYSVLDSRISVIHKVNGGVSSARNIALERLESEGGFDKICFMDSDDYVLSDFLKTFVDTSVAYSADCVACGWDEFDKVGVWKRGKSGDHEPCLLDRVGAFEHLFGLSEIGRISKSQSRFLANRCFSYGVLAGLRFDESLKRAEDQEFLLRAMLRVKKCVVVGSPNYMYRVRRSSLTHKGSLFLDDMRFSVALLGKKDVFPESIRAQLDRFAESNWWTCVRRLVLEGEFDDRKSELDFYRDIIKGMGGGSFRLMKRLFFYSLGEWFLRNFVFVRERKKSFRVEAKMKDAFE